MLLLFVAALFMSLFQQVTSTICLPGFTKACGPGQLCPTGSMGANYNLTTGEMVLSNLCTQVSSDLPLFAVPSNESLNLTFQGEFLNDLRVEFFDSSQSLQFFLIFGGWSGTTNYISTGPSVYSGYFTCQNPLPSNTSYQNLAVNLTVVSDPGVILVEMYYEGTLVACRTVTLTSLPSYFSFSCYQGTVKIREINPNIILSPSPTSSPTTPHTSSPTTSPLSSGAIAGIVVGSFLVFLAGAGCLLAFVFRRKKKENSTTLANAEKA